MDGAVNLSVDENGSARSYVKAGFGKSVSRAVDTSNAVFAAFDLRVQLKPAISSSRKYPIIFGDGSGGGLSTDVRLYLQQTSATPTEQKFKIGIGEGASTSSLISSTLTSDQTYRVVMGFDFNSKKASLYLDPEDGDDVAATYTFSDVSFSINAIGLRQAKGIGSFDLDNLIVATSFAETIPEPAAGGVLLVGMGLLGWRRPG
jgi:hypothetical protein